MKVISAVGKVRLEYKNPVLAIGVFDGVHLGHQYLIKKMIAKAKSLNGTSVVMTFYPHPVHILQPSIELSYIVSLKHRLKLIEDLGADICIVIHFTKRFSRLSPQRFIKEFLMQWIRPREVFVGEDFRFGQNRSGDLEFFIREGNHMGFHVNIVPSVTSSGAVISSSRIRKFITNGHLQMASKLLGRRVSVSGKVTKGDSRGIKLGFPTANICQSADVFPPCGVYAVKVIFDKKEYYGMANIGRRPSFKNNERINLEVYIFDFNKNIYGKEIIVEFIKKFREEKKFPSQAALIAQLKRDERKARKLLSEMLPEKH